MRTNEGVPEPSDEEQCDPGNYLVEERIYPGDEDDEDDRRVGDPCVEITCKGFVLVRMFGPRRHRIAREIMRNQLGR